MRKIMETEVKGLAKKVEAVVADDKLSKSGKMRELFHLGLEVKEIAELLGVRYNFVYNVVSNLIIVEGVEVEQNKQASKKDEAWALFDEGKTVKEVAITLKTNYNYIYKLRKEWTAQAAQEVAEMEAAIDVVGGDK